MVLVPCAAFTYTYMYITNKTKYFMKKHLFTLLALLALTVSAWADPVTHQQQVGDFWYEFYDEYGFASLIKLPGSESYASYTGLSGDITIPGTVNDGSQDYPVTGIGYEAFVGCSDITSVTVEEGVDYISNFAFMSCSNLTTATLPSTITSFGNQVFGFSGLTSVTIRATSPANISENNPFADADNLAHIYVPAASVEAYKTAWSDYASIIEEIPSGPAPATTTVTWDTEDVNTISLICNSVDDVQTTPSIDGITASLRRISDGGNCEIGSSSARDLWITDNSGELTFTSSVGNISGIVLYAGSYVYTSPYNLSTGWTWDGEATTLTWTGAASSQVTLSGNMDFLVSSIEFTVESAAAPADPSLTTITWEETDLATLDLFMEGGQFIKDMVVMAAYADDNNDYVSFKYEPDPADYCGFSMNNNGSLTFTPASGKLTSIVINWNYEGSDPDLVPGSGWSFSNSKLTWTSDDEDGAESVVLKSNSSEYLASGPISSIVFTVKDAAAPVANTVTWTTPMVKIIDLKQYTNYYSQDYHYEPTSVEMRDVEVSVSALADGAYAHFKTQYDNTNIYLHDGGTLTFTSATREFASIVINFDGENGGSGYANDPSEWNSIESTLTWEGEEASNTVVLADAGVDKITSIVFTYATDPEPDPMPSGPSFTWEQRQVNHVKMNCDYGETKTTPVIKNIITSLTKTNNIGNCYFGDFGYGQFEIMDNCGTLTFQSIVGDLTGIIITCSSVNYATDLSADWRYDSETGKLIWVGTQAETVTLSGDIKITISSIEFFYDPAPAPRLGEKISDNLYEITGAHTAKVIPQTHGQTYNIPSYVDDEDVRYYITEIDEYAFANMEEGGNVYVNGENLAKIGAYAFKNSPRLTLVAIYSKVLDEIGEEAFMNCKLMSFFECHTAVPPVLGNNAFTGATYMNHIVVNQFDDVDAVENYKAAPGWSTYADKIIEIGGVATPGELFFFHNQMTTGWYAVSSGSPREAKVLQYSAEVKALYPRTLEGTLVIPEEVPYMSSSYTVTGIGANAYKDSTDINVVLIPQAVKSIESGAFLNCTGVENVYFLWDDPTTVTWADATIGAEFATAASHNTKIIVPSGKLATYQSWAPAWASCMMEGELLPVTATQDPHYQARYYRTFYDSEHDYMLPPSVWAHAGYVQGSEFILHPVAFDGQTLPRGTAVVLESETQEYRLIAVGNDAPLYTGPNDLIGTDVAFPRADLGANADKVYVLGRQATINENSQVGMGMYRYTGTTLGAHKAYMILNTSNPSSAPVRFLFKHEDQATDVENVGVQSEKASCAKILRNGQLIIIKDGKEYNAQGQVVK